MRQIKCGQMFCEVTNICLNDSVCQVGDGGSRPPSSWSSHHEELQGERNKQTHFTISQRPCYLAVESDIRVCVCVQEFLLNMEDSVDETESVKRYNQYKLDFRRQQLQDFFLQHKDQEWFRSKYHPDDITARKAESLAALKTRLGVFLFLLDTNWLDNVSLDMEHAPAIIKLLDAGEDRLRRPAVSVQGILGNEVL